MDPVDYVQESYLKISKPECYNILSKMSPFQQKLWVVKKREKWNSVIYNKERKTFSRIWFWVVLMLDLAKTSKQLL